MNSRQARIIFILTVIFAIFPIPVFILSSTWNHELTDSPSITGQTLDLSGYDFRVEPVIALNGAWEFFNDQWIITETKASDTPHEILSVPSIDQNRIIWPENPANNIGSYRIRLENCPPETDLFLYIPRINSSYRVFLDGTPISGKGYMDITGKPYCEPVHTNSIVNNLSFYDPYNSGKGGTKELVIELAGPLIDGLYMTPYLTSYSRYQSLNYVRSIFAAGVTGVIILLILMVASNLILMSKSIYSIALLTIDLLMFIRILFLNEYLSFMKHFIVLRDYFNYMILQVVCLFLPIVFLYCARHFHLIPVDRKLVRFILYYELLLTPPLLFCAYMGFPRLLFTLCLICYLPFIPVMYQFYRYVKLGIPNMLLVSSILLLVISSLIVSNLNSSGLLIRDESLFAPFCFMLSMLLQLWMYIRHSLTMQLEAANTAVLRLQLKESETKIMLSQIKPHFLHNSLIAIHMLCTREPELAAETILKFATFLRTNMNFISSMEPIMFGRELEHIRNYAELEKLRFQERIHIVYDIREEEFRVPPLSIQPLVENAIRHGACRNVLEGTVWITSLSTDTGWRITVRDDGPGFDPLSSALDPAEPHGLQNVRFRLTQQMNARFEIQSAPGQGTTVIVDLPKGTEL